MKITNTVAQPQTTAPPADTTPPVFITSQPAATTRRQKFHVLAVLAACFVGIAAIAKFILLKQSLRLDEAQTLWQASHTVPGLLKVVAQDVHVPLYHLIVHFWLQYVSGSIESVRLLSLLFFAVTIPFVYLLARQVMSYKWALLATVLFSFSPFMNWYGNEARMYTLLVMMAVINQYYFVRILRGKSGWVGFYLSAMVGVYSHYFFAFTLVAEGIFFLANRRYFPLKTLRRLLALAILLIVILAPWLHYFYALGAASNTRPLVPKPSAVDFFNAYSQFMFGFQNNRINTILVSCWPLLVIFAFFAVRRMRGINRSVQFYVTIATVPILMAFGLSLIVQPFFLSRYMISSLPALVIVLVWFLSHYPRRLATALLAAALLITIGTSYSQDYSIDNPVREDYKQAAQYISSHATDRDAIVLSAPFTVYPFEYYYNGNVQIDTLPTWNRAKAGTIPAYDAKKLPEYVSTVKANHKYIYVLLSYNQGYEQQVRIYLDTHLERVSSKHFSPDMNLYVYRVDYNKIQQL